jgi:hypothetical protein
MNLFGMNGLHLVCFGFTRSGSGSNLAKICRGKEWNVSLVVDFQVSVTETRTFIHSSAFA